MGIGLEPNDRRFGVWQDTEDVAEHTIQTADLVSMFGIPMGMHLFIERWIVTVENGESCQVTFDGKGRRNVGLNGVGEIRSTVTGGINGSMMPVGRHFIAIGVTGSLQNQQKFLDIPVYDEIVIFKGAANDMIHEIYYHFEAGAMFWLDEWADLLKDKANVPLSHTRGRIYTQIGDYFQINKRPA